LARHSKQEILVSTAAGAIFTRATLKRMGIREQVCLALCASPDKEPAMRQYVFRGSAELNSFRSHHRGGQPALHPARPMQACLFPAGPLVHNDVERRPGYVGYLTSVNVDFPRVPVAGEVAAPSGVPSAVGADNELLQHQTADHMAAATARSSLEADHLIYFSTDVAGVLNGREGSSAISCEEIDRLINSPFVSGGNES